MKSSLTSNPKLIISHYYDCLVRYVDIYIEERLGRTWPILNNNKQLIENRRATRDEEIETENWGKSEYYLDLDNLVDIWSRKPISDLICKENELSFDLSLNLLPAINCFNIDLSKPPNNVIHDYLNRVRDEMLAELERAQLDTFLNYERNVRDALKRDELLSKLGKLEKMEYLEKKVFAKKSYLMIRQELEPPITHHVRLYLIRLDFYLCQSEQQILR